MLLVGLYVLLTYPSCSEAQKIQKELWEAGERLVGGERGTGGVRLGEWGPGAGSALSEGSPQGLKRAGLPRVPWPRPTQKEAFPSRYI